MSLECCRYPLGLAQCVPVLHFEVESTIEEVSSAPLRFCALESFLQWKMRNGKWS